MAIPTRLQGDFIITGNLAPATVTLPAGGVDDAAIKPSANIDATKLEHQHRVPYSQPNSAATAETRVVYRCYGATGDTVDFSAGSIAVAVGAAVATLDLKKNGTTVLSAPITLNSGNAARVAVSATVSVPALVAGDVLEVVTTATAGGGTLPTGLFASLTVHEKAA